MKTLTRNICLLLTLVAVALPAMAQTNSAGGLVWDSHKKGNWSEGFEQVAVKSSNDGQAQAAYVHWSDGGKPRPLVISLHTWGGDYKQVDPLAPLAVAGNWNYIHPDFRGTNTKPDACMSPLVISDIDDAVSFMLADPRVDKDNVFLVGISGGAYAACGMYMKSHHTYRRILAWAPISDLGKWYEQCAANHARANYAKDVLACVGKDGQLDVAAAQARSPLLMDIPNPPPGGLDIYEGIDDGWKGSVPISHSIDFYNKLATHFNETLATPEEEAALLARKWPPDKDYGMLGTRKILFARGSGAVTLTIFQGGHEMLSQPCFDMIQALANSPPNATH